MTDIHMAEAGGTASARPASRSWLPLRGGARRREFLGCTVDALGANSPSITFGATDDTAVTGDALTAAGFALLPIAPPAVERPWKRRAVMAGRRRSG